MLNKSGIRFLGHKKPRERKEEKMLMDVMKWASYHPICKDYLIHIANERKCSKEMGRKLKLQGVKKGVWDLFLLYPVNFFPGLWLELKIGKNKLSDSQEKWGETIKKAGFATAVVHDDWEKVKKIIEGYLNGSFKML
jgi:hypothetical protein